MYPFFPRKYQFVMEWFELIGLIKEIDQTALVVKDATPVSVATWNLLVSQFATF